jgi:hypothetical protein
LPIPHILSAAGLENRSLPFSFRAGPKLSDIWQKSGYTAMPGCISIEPRKEEIDTDWYKSTIGERGGTLATGNTFLFRE